MTSTAFFTTQSKRSLRKACLGGMAAATLFASHALRAQDATPAEHLYNLAKATSLTREGILPWHLRVTFTVNKIDGGRLDTGTLDVNWTAARHQIVTVDSGVLHGKLPANDMAYTAGTLREVHLLRELIDQTIQPVASFDGAKDLAITEQLQKFGNVELSCLSVSRGNPSKKPGGGSTRFCSATSDPTILRLHLDFGTEIIRNRIALFQKTNVALDNVISYSGKVAISGHTEVLEADKTASTASAPQQPESYQGIQAHSMVMAGHKIKGDVPSYPVTARAGHISGTVILFAVIDKTGHIQYLVPIGSPDGSLTESALTAVRTWTYQPYLLDGQPEEVDTTITVNYNLSY